MCSEAEGRQHPDEPFGTSARKIHEMNCRFFPYISGSLLLAEMTDLRISEILDTLNISEQSHKKAFSN
jgi:hypothetical protein